MSRLAWPAAKGRHDERTTPFAAFAWQSSPRDDHGSERLTLESQENYRDFTGFAGGACRSDVRLLFAFQREPQVC